MANRQWKGTTGGGNFGQNSLIFLFRLCGVRIGYALLALVVPFYMLFARQGFRAIYHYFRKRFHFSVFKSLIHTYYNHFLFGQMMLDRFAVYADKAATFTTEIEGKNLFEQAISSDKSTLIATSHVGNAEISGYLFQQDKKVINTIIFGGENVSLQHKRNRIFAQHNIKPIAVTDGISHIFAINEAISRGEMIQMPCDRVFTGNKTYSYPFLCTEAQFPMGAFHIATKLNLPVICLFVIKTNWTTYKAFVRKLEIQQTENKADNAQKLAQAYIIELEKIIQQYPDQWFNFYEFWN